MSPDSLSLICQWTSRPFTKKSKQIKNWTACSLLFIPYKAYPSWLTATISPDSLCMFCYFRALTKKSRLSKPYHEKRSMIMKITYSEIVLENLDALIFKLFVEILQVSQVSCISWLFLKHWSEIWVFFLQKCQIFLQILLAVNSCVCKLFETWWRIARRKAAYRLV